jgi:hypothetical protein
VLDRLESLGLKWRSSDESETGVYRRSKPRWELEPEACQGAADALSALNLVLRAFGG